MKVVTVDLINTKGVAVAGFNNSNNGNKTWPLLFTRTLKWIKQLGYNWVFFRFSIFGFMSSKTLTMILSLGSILECQMALIKFATSHITKNFVRVGSTMLKANVKMINCLCRTVRFRLEV